MTPVAFILIRSNDIKCFVSINPYHYNYCCPSIHFAGAIKKPAIYYYCRFVQKSVLLIIRRAVRICQFLISHSPAGKRIIPYFNIHSGFARIIIRINVYESKYA